MAFYDAFISYSHAKDRPIAAALQSVIQRLGKPWYTRRALRVFRDDTSLSATPELWPSIERALGQSRYFILLASPSAASSKWVSKEVAWWLDQNKVESLLIGLTEGNLQWDEITSDFSWRDGTPLPSMLARQFPAEPKWVDLRAYRDGTRSRNAKFIELSAEFAATICGVPKEDLLSQEVRQQRRALTLATSAVGLLLILAGVAYWQRDHAVRNEQEATAQRDQALIAQSRFLADAARQAIAAGDSGTAMALALDALPDLTTARKRPYVSEAELSLYESVLNLAEKAVLAHNVTVGDMSWMGPAGAARDVATHEEMIQYSLDRLPLGVHMFTLMGGVRAVFSQNGSMVVTWGNDGARVWDAKSHRQLALLKPSKLGVDAAAISPDASRVVTAFPDGTAHIWNTADWSEAAVLRGHSKSLISISFSPDGSHIVTGSWDKTARVWETSTGRQLMQLKGHSGGVNIAFFSRDGSRIVTASDDKTVRVWDASTGQQLVILSGHTESIFSAEMSPDERLIATAANDGTARLWGTNTGKQLGYLARVGAVSVSFSPDGSRVIVASRSGAATVVDVNSLAEIGVLRGHSRGVLSAAYSPTGSFIVTASNDGSARLWNSQTSSEVRVFNGHQRGLFGAVFSPDGRTIATMSFDGTARLWGTGRSKLDSVYNYASESQKFLMLSPNGKRVLRIFKDNNVHIIDRKTQADLVVLKGHKGTVFSAAFSSDGSRVVTASYDATARIWDSYSGREIAVLKGHQGSVLSAVFSPDGSRIATGSSDRTARVWNIGKNATIAIIRSPGYEVHHVAFSSDGTRLITAPQQGEGNTWPLFSDTQHIVDYAKSVIPRCLTQQQRLHYFLNQGPPRWCIELAKWPYNTPQWQNGSARATRAGR
jgi:WD40 repeat protein